MLANTSTGFVLTHTVMQWRLGVARRIQALIFLLSHRLEPSRHFLANFLVISDHIWHLNITDCFRGKGLAFDLNNSLQTLFKPSLFLSHQVPYTQTRLTNTSNQQKKPMYFLIHYYITGRTHSFTLINIHSFNTQSIVYKASYHKNTVNTDQHST